MRHKLGHIPIKSYLKCNIIRISFWLLQEVVNSIRFYEKSQYHVQLKLNPKR